MRAVSNRALARQLGVRERAQAMMSQAAARSGPRVVGKLAIIRLQRRHRAHRVLRLILYPAMVRRWRANPFGFLRPWNELPALMVSATPSTPPSTGTGVI